MNAPLEGVRVVEVSINVSGPVATMILGDLGADVIKVESPAGDPMRRAGPSNAPNMAALFVCWNRNKRSIVLDLKKAAGLEALMRLVETADVFVHNMRSSAATRLGIDYGSIQTRNSRVVYCAVTGFRDEGRYGGRPAYDDVIQGMSGIAALNARLFGTPRYMPMLFVDKFTACSVASAVSSALFRRERSGEGCEIQVPMFETATWFNLLEHLWQGARGRPEEGLGYPRMFGNAHGPLPTKDGHICIAASTDMQWRRLFAVVGRGDLADDPRFLTMAKRTENIAAAYQLVSDQLSLRTTADWRQLLDAADIVNEPMNDLKDLLKDPHLADIGFFERREHPAAGTMVMVPHPTLYDRTPAATRLLPPELGEHTVSILKELGYSAEEIEEILHR